MPGPVLASVPDGVRRMLCVCHSDGDAVYLVLFTVTVYLAWPESAGRAALLAGRGQEVHSDSGLAAARPGGRGGGSRRLPAEPGPEPEIARHV